MRSWPVQPNLASKDTLHTEAHFVSDPHNIMEHVETDLCVESNVRNV